MLGQRGARQASMRQTAVNFDVFGEDQFWITKTFAATLGSQLSFAERSNESAGKTDSQNWWAFNPKIGVLFQPDPSTQVFANVSRSFEPPSFGEMIVNNAFTRLQSQTATTAEIGSRGNSGGLVWDAAYYFSWIENELLSVLTIPGNPNSAVTKNAGKTSHQGIELGLGFDFLHPINEDIAAPKAASKNRDKLVIQTNYLWNNFRYRNDRDYGNGPLAGIPEHYLRADLTYSNPAGFYVGPNIECVPQGYRVDAKGNLSTDPYFLLGAKVGIRRPNGWSIYVEGRNLTDRHYAATTTVLAQAAANSAAFLPGDGRSFFAGIEYRW
jgi:iron complex outermembrane receptor protein